MAVVRSLYAQFEATPEARRRVRESVMKVMMDQADKKCSSEYAGWSCQFEMGHWGDHCCGVLRWSNYTKPAASPPQRPSALTSTGLFEPKYKVGDRVHSPVAGTGTVEGVYKEPRVGSWMVAVRLDPGLNNGVWTHHTAPELFFQPVAELPPEPKPSSSERGERRVVAARNRLGEAWDKAMELLDATAGDMPQPWRNVTIELVAEQIAERTSPNFTLPDLKVGDRVRACVGSSATLCLGEVIQICKSSAYPYVVRLNLGGARGFKRTDLTLIPK